MNFEQWAKAKGHPFHDLEPTFNGVKDRYSDMAREAWDAAASAEREACAQVCEDLEAYLEDNPGESFAEAIRARNK